VGVETQAHLTERRDLYHGGLSALVGASASSNDNSALHHGVADGEYEVSAFQLCKAVKIAATPLHCAWRRRDRMILTLRHDSIEGAFSFRERSKTRLR
jgi:hypothetical protein